VYFRIRCLIIFDSLFIIGKVDINRVRFTVGDAQGKYDAKGKALTDKGKLVDDFFSAEELKGD